MEQVINKTTRIAVIMIIVERYEGVKLGKKGKSIELLPGIYEYTELTDKTINTIAYTIPRTILAIVLMSIILAEVLSVGFPENLDICLSFDKYEKKNTKRKMHKTITANDVNRTRIAEEIVDKPAGNIDNTSDKPLNIRVVMNNFKHVSYACLYNRCLVLIMLFVSFNSDMDTPPCKMINNVPPTLYHICTYKGKGDKI